MPVTKKKKATETKSLLPDASDYRQLSEIEHVLKRPDMWMGNIKMTDIPFWFLSEELKLEKKTINASRSVFHIFSEMMTNASDNAAMSRAANYPVGDIHVEVLGKVVSIENNGVPIPIEKNESGMYIPDMVFGNLRTGINFGDIEDKSGNVNAKTKVRKGAGKNGLGAKIGNIYSKWFTVECCDTIRKKRYTQRWENNMNVRSEPVIEDYNGQLDILDKVKITYELEFSRFGYPQDYEYSSDMINALRFIACNNAMSQNVPVFFNNQVLPCTLTEFVNVWREMPLPVAVEDNIILEKNKDASKDKVDTTDKEVSKDIVEKESNEAVEISEEVNEPKEPNVNETDEINVLSEEIKELIESAAKGNDIYHIEWPIGTEMGKNKKPKNISLLPELEVYIFDKIDGFHGLTFSTTSGAINTEGGEHEKAVWNALTTIFEPKFKNVTKAYIRDQLIKSLSLIVIYRAENPEFSDQSKVKLNFPKPTLIFSDIERKQLGQWYIIDYINELINMQAMMNAKKSDGKRVRMVTVKRLDDAGYAGKKGSEHTSLCYVEGKSALGYPVAMRDVTPNGVNLIGTLYSKGKVINSVTHTVQKLVANEQYIELKKALGLVEDVDYTKIDNRAKLRYGELLIMTDADMDGSHIKGLVFLLLSTRFPSLIKSGFVKVWCSPIVRAYRKRGTQVLETKTFYTGYEFEEWSKEADMSQWKHIKYVKGLAGSNKTEVKYDMKNPKKLVVTYDESSENYLNLAFGKGFEDLRKKWISKYEPKKFDIRNMDEITISEFVAYELVSFALYSVERSIPSMYDGFKVSQRKCVEGSFDQWKSSATQYGNTPVKLDELATHCSKTTNYHHGVGSLIGAIRNMCQDYVGTNNIPIYIPDSQLGTRLHRGEDGGAERYVFLSINPFVKRAWIKDDDNVVLDYINEENKKCEPVHYEPVVNMLLINGSAGIGTGSSCEWPCHKVEDVCAAQLAFIDRKPIPELVPYYNGFKGKVYVEKTVKKEKPIKTLELSHNKFTTSPVRKSDVYNRVFFEGIVTGNSKRAEITEIPPSISIMDYKNYLKEQVDKKVISSFEDIGTSNNPHLVIYKHLAPIKENLQLTESLILSNLVALDELGRTHRYNTTNEYFLWWCGHRLSVYEERKKKVISTYKEKIEAIDVNIRFLDAYFDKKFSIEGKEDDEIKDQLMKLGFDFDMLSKINLNQLSKTRYQALLKKKEDATEELVFYEKTSTRDLWKKEIQEFLAEYKTYIKYRKDMNKDLE